MKKGEIELLKASKNGNLEKLNLLLDEEKVDVNFQNNNGLSALHLAAKEGHVVIIKELLRRGADVDASSSKGNTSLHIASLCGKDEVVDNLLKAGAKVNIQSTLGFTSLYMAAQENHPSIVENLLKYGADPSISTHDGFTPMDVAKQLGYEPIISLLASSSMTNQKPHNNTSMGTTLGTTRGSIRLNSLPKLHAAAKRDDMECIDRLIEEGCAIDGQTRSGFTALHIACHYGKLQAAKRLIEHKADINFSKARNSITPMHVAAKWGFQDIISLLLKYKADIESRTDDGLTPLHCASRFGKVKVIETLLDGGAVIDPRSRNSLTPLHMAVQGDHKDCVELLIGRQAAIEATTVDNLTPLHVAAHCGHVSAAEVLLKNNCNPCAEALNGFTPLHIACKKNRVPVIELLLSYYGNNVNIRTKAGLSPLHIAAFMGHGDLLNLLISKGSEVNSETYQKETPLHLAVRAGQIDCVQALIDSNADCNATTKYGYSPLHLAAQSGNEKIVYLLINKGVEVDAKTNSSLTPLHLSSREGHVTIVDMLLTAGADAELRSKRGLTPVHLSSKYGNYEVASVLIERGSEVNVLDKNGLTPLHHAIQNGHHNVAKLLLSKASDPHSIAKNGYTPLHVAALYNRYQTAKLLLEKYQVNPLSKSLNGFTPLHLACKEGHKEMVALLLSSSSASSPSSSPSLPGRAIKEYQSIEGIHPLHLAAQENHVSIIQLLLETCSNADITTKNHYTPLHLACYHGNMEAVKVLLNQGANPNSVTKDGYTPLHFASQEGKSSTVKCLLDSKANPNLLSNTNHTPYNLAHLYGFRSVEKMLEPMTKTHVDRPSDGIARIIPETINEVPMEDSDDEIESERVKTSDFASPYEDGQDQKGDSVFDGSSTPGFPSGDRSISCELKYLSDEAEFYVNSVLLSQKSNEEVRTLETGNRSAGSGSYILRQKHLYPSHYESRGSTISMTHSLQRSDVSDSFYSMDLGDAPIQSGFLVSFVVDARGKSMCGMRHSGVRIIVSPGKTCEPIRVTCKLVNPDKLTNPPIMSEGEGLASRILKMGPAGASFEGPVVIEVPHFAVLQDHQRDIVILRSDDGETWKEHINKFSISDVENIVRNSFGEELGSAEELYQQRIARIITCDFPKYFALVSTLTFDRRVVGSNGEEVASNFDPRVSLTIPNGAFNKKINIKLQVQKIPEYLQKQMASTDTYASPVVTIEPRRRKFHQPITVKIPLPHDKQSGKMHLLCSLSEGKDISAWEDISDKSSLKNGDGCVYFYTSVSGRFWLVETTQPEPDIGYMSQVYEEVCLVPYLSQFVLFARRPATNKGVVRLICSTEGKLHKTLESREHYSELAQSSNVEVQAGRKYSMALHGNLDLYSKLEDEQLEFIFHPFKENRLSTGIYIRDLTAQPASTAILTSAATNFDKGREVCSLDFVLPACEKTKQRELPSQPSSSIDDSLGKKDEESQPSKLTELAASLGDDWINLARAFKVDNSEIESVQKKAASSTERADIFLNLLIPGLRTEDDLSEGLRFINRPDVAYKWLDLKKPKTDTENEEMLFKRVLEEYLPWEKHNEYNHNKTKSDGSLVWIKSTAVTPSSIQEKVIEFPQEICVLDKDDVEISTQARKVVESLLDGTYRERSITKINLIMKMQWNKLNKESPQESLAREFQMADLLSHELDNRVGETKQMKPDGTLILKRGFQKSLMARPTDPDAVEEIIEVDPHVDEANISSVEGEVIESLDNNFRFDNGAFGSKLIKKTILRPKALAEFKDKKPSGNESPDGRLGKKSFVEKDSVQEEKESQNERLAMMFKLASKMLPLLDLKDFIAAEVQDDKTIVWKRLKRSSNNSLELIEESVEVLPEVDISNEDNNNINFFVRSIKEFHLDGRNTVKEVHRSIISHKKIPCKQSDIASLTREFQVACSPSYVLDINSPESKNKKVDGTLVIKRCLRKAAGCHEMIPELVEEVIEIDPHIEETTISNIEAEIVNARIDDETFGTKFVKQILLRPRVPVQKQVYDQYKSLKESQREENPTIDASVSLQKYLKDAEGMFIKYLPDIELKEYSLVMSEPGCPIIWKKSVSKSDGPSEKVEEVVEIDPGVNANIPDVEVITVRREVNEQLPNGSSKTKSIVKTFVRPRSKTDFSGQESVMKEFQSSHIPFYMLKTADPEIKSDSSDGTVTCIRLFKKASGASQADPDMIEEIIEVDPAVNHANFSDLNVVMQNIIFNYKLDDGSFGTKMIKKVILRPGRISQQNISSKKDFGQTTLVEYSTAKEIPISQKKAQETQKDEIIAIKDVVFDVWPDLNFTGFVPQERKFGTLMVWKKLISKPEEDSKVVEEFIEVCPEIENLNPENLEKNTYLRDINVHLPDGSSTCKQIRKTIIGPKRKSELSRKLHQQDLLVDEFQMKDVPFYTIDDLNVTSRITKPDGTLVFIRVFKKSLQAEESCPDVIEDILEGVPDLFEVGISNVEAEVFETKIDNFKLEDGTSGTKITKKTVLKPKVFPKTAEPSSLSESPRMSEFAGVMKETNSELNRTIYATKIISEKLPNVNLKEFKAEMVEPNQSLIWKKITSPSNKSTEVIIETVEVVPGTENIKMEDIDLNIQIRMINEYLLNDLYFNKVVKRSILKPKHTFHELEEQSQINDLIKEFQITYLPYYELNKVCPEFKHYKSDGTLVLKRVFEKSFEAKWIDPDIVEEMVEVDPNLIQFGFCHVEAKTTETKENYRLDENTFGTKLIRKTVLTHKVAEKHSNNNIEKIDLGDGKKIDHDVDVIYDTRLSLTEEDEPQIIDTLSSVEKSQANQDARYLVAMSVISEKLPGFNFEEFKPTEIKLGRPVIIKKTTSNSSRPFEFSEESVEVLPGVENMNQDDVDLCTYVREVKEKLKDGTSSVKFIRKTVIRPKRNLKPYSPQLHQEILANEFQLLDLSSYELDNRNQLLKYIEPDGKLIIKRLFKKKNGSRISDPDIFEEIIEVDSGIDEISSLNVEAEITEVKVEDYNLDTNKIETKLIRRAILKPKLMKIIDSHSEVEGGKCLSLLEQKSDITKAINISSLPENVKNKNDYLTSSAMELISDKCPGIDLTGFKPEKTRPDQHLVLSRITAIPSTEIQVVQETIELQAGVEYLDKKDVQVKNLSRDIKQTLVDGTHQITEMKKIVLQPKHNFKQMSKQDIIFNEFQTTDLPSYKIDKEDERNLKADGTLVLKRVFKKSPGSKKTDPDVVEEVVETDPAIDETSISNLSVEIAEERVDRFKLDDGTYGTKIIRKTILKPKIPAVPIPEIVCMEIQEPTRPEVSSQIAQSEPVAEIVPAKIQEPSKIDKVAVSDIISHKVLEPSKGKDVVVGDNLERNKEIFTAAQELVSGKLPAVDFTEFQPSSMKPGESTVWRKVSSRPERPSEIFEETVEVSPGAENMDQDNVEVSTTVREIREKLPDGTYSVKEVKRTIVKPKQKPKKRGKGKKEPQQDILAQEFQSTDMPSYKVDNEDERKLKADGTLVLKRVFKKSPGSKKTDPDVVEEVVETDPGIDETNISNISVEIAEERVDRFKLDDGTYGTKIIRKTILKPKIPAVPIPEIVCMEIQEPTRPEVSSHIAQSEPVPVFVPIEIQEPSKTDKVAVSDIISHKVLEPSKGKDVAVGDNLERNKEIFTAAQELISGKLPAVDFTEFQPSSMKPGESTVWRKVSSRPERPSKIFEETVEVSPGAENMDQDNVEVSTTVREIREKLPDGTYSVKEVKRTIVKPKQKPKKRGKGKKEPQQDILAQEFQSTDMPSYKVDNVDERELKADGTLVLKRVFKKSPGSKKTDPDVVEEVVETDPGIDETNISNISVEIAEERVDRFKLDDGTYGTKIIRKTILKPKIPAVPIPEIVCMEIQEPTRPEVSSQIAHSEPVPVFVPIEIQEPSKTDKVAVSDIISHKVLEPSKRKDVAVGDNLERNKEIFTAAQELISGKLPAVDFTEFQPSSMKPGESTVWRKVSSRPERPSEIFEETVEVSPGAENMDQDNVEVSTTVREIREKLPDGTYSVKEVKRTIVKPKQKPKKRGKGKKEPPQDILAQEFQSTDMPSYKVDNEDERKLKADGTLVLKRVFKKSPGSKKTDPDVVEEVVETDPGIDETNISNLSVEIAEERVDRFKLDGGTYGTKIIRKTILKPKIPAVPIPEIVCMEIQEPTRPEVSSQIAQSEPVAEIVPTEIQKPSKIDKVAVSDIISHKVLEPSKGKDVAVGDNLERNKEIFTAAQELVSGKLPAVDFTEFQPSSMKPGESTVWRKVSSRPERPSEIFEETVEVSPGAENMDQDNVEVSTTVREIREKLPDGTYSVKEVKRTIVKPKPKKRGKGKKEPQQDILAQEFQSTDMPSYKVDNEDERKLKADGTLVLKRVFKKSPGSKKTDPDVVEEVVETDPGIDETNISNLSVEIAEERVDRFKLDDGTYGTKIIRKTILKPKILAVPIPEIVCMEIQEPTRPEVSSQIAQSEPVAEIVPTEIQKPSKIDKVAVSDIISHKVLEPSKGKDVAVGDNLERNKEIFTAAQELVSGKLPAVDFTEFQPSSMKPGESTVWRKVSSRPERPSEIFEETVEVSPGAENMDQDNVEVSTTVREIREKLPDGTYSVKEVKRTIVKPKQKPKKRGKGKKEPQQDILAQEFQSTDMPSYKVDNEDERKLKADGTLVLKRVFKKSPGSKKTDPDVVEEVVETDPGIDETNISNISVEIAEERVDRFKLDDGTYGTKIIRKTILKPKIPAVPIPEIVCMEIQEPTRPEVSSQIAQSEPVPVFVPIEIQEPSKTDKVAVSDIISHKVLEPSKGKDVAVGDNLERNKEIFTAAQELISGKLPAVDFTEFQPSSMKPGESTVWRKVSSRPERPSKIFEETVEVSPGAENMDQDNVEVSTTVREIREKLPDGTYSVKEVKRTIVKPKQKPKKRGKGKKEPQQDILAQEFQSTDMPSYKVDNVDERELKADGTLVLKRVFKKSPGSKKTDPDVVEEVVETDPGIDETNISNISVEIAEERVDRFKLDDGTYGTKIIRKTILKPKIPAVPIPEIVCMEIQEPTRPEVSSQIAHSEPVPVFVPIEIQEPSKTDKVAVSDIISHKVLEPSKRKDVAVGDNLERNKEIFTAAQELISGKLPAVDFTEFQPSSMKPGESTVWRKVSSRPERPSEIFEETVEVSPGAENMDQDNVEVSTTVREIREKLPDGTYSVKEVKRTIVKPKQKPKKRGKGKKEPPQDILAQEFQSTDMPSYKVDNEDERKLKADGTLVLKRVFKKSPGSKKTDPDVVEEVVETDPGIDETNISNLSVEIAEERVDRFKLDDGTYGTKIIRKTILKPKIPAVPIPEIVCMEIQEPTRPEVSSQIAQSEPVAEIVPTEIQKPSKIDKVAVSDIISHKVLEPSKGKDVAVGDNLERNKEIFTAAQELVSGKLPAVDFTEFQPSSMKPGESTVWRKVSSRPERPSEIFEETVEVSPGAENMDQDNVEVSTTVREIREKLPDGTYSVKEVKRTIVKPKPKKRGKGKKEPQQDILAQEFQSTDMPSYKVDNEDERKLKADGTLVLKRVFKKSPGSKKTDPDVVEEVVETDPGIDETNISNLSVEIAEERVDRFKLDDGTYGTKIIRKTILKPKIPAVPIPEIVCMEIQEPTRPEVSSQIAQSEPVAEIVPTEIQKPSKIDKVAVSDIISHKVLEPSKGKDVAVGDNLERNKEVFTAAQELVSGKLPAVDFTEFQPSSMKPGESTVWRKVSSRPERPSEIFEETVEVSPGAENMDQDNVEVSTTVREIREKLPDGTYSVKEVKRTIVKPKPKKRGKGKKEPQQDILAQEFQSTDMPSYKVDNVDERKLKADGTLVLKRVFKKSPGSKKTDPDVVEEVVETDPGIDETNISNISVEIAEERVDRFKLDDGTYGTKIIRKTILKPKIPAVPIPEIVCMEIQEPTRPEVSSHIAQSEPVPVFVPIEIQEPSKTNKVAVSDIISHKVLEPSKGKDVAVGDNLERNKEIFTAAQELVSGKLPAVDFTEFQPSSMKPGESTVWRKVSSRPERPSEIFEETVEVSPGAENMDQDNVEVSTTVREIREKLPDGTYSVKEVKRTIVKPKPKKRGKGKKEPQQDILAQEFQSTDMPSYKVDNEDERKLKADGTLVLKRVFKKSPGSKKTDPDVVEEVVETDPGIDETNISNISVEIAEERVDRFKLDDGTYGTKIIRKTILKPMIPAVPIPEIVCMEIQEPTRPEVSSQIAQAEPVPEIVPIEIQEPSKTEVPESLQPQSVSVVVDREKREVLDSVKLGSSLKDLEQYPYNEELSFIFKILPQLDMTEFKIFEYKSDYPIVWKKISKSLDSFVVFEDTVEVLPALIKLHEYEVKVSTLKRKVSEHLSDSSFRLKHLTRYIVEPKLKNISSARQFYLESLVKEFQLTKVQAYKLDKKHSKEKSVGLDGKISVKRVLKKSQGGDWTDPDLIEETIEISSDVNEKNFYEIDVEASEKLFENIKLGDGSFGNKVVRKITIKPGVGGNTLAEEPLESQMLSPELNSSEIELLTEVSDKRENIEKHVPVVPPTAEEIKGYSPQVRPSQEFVVLTGKREICEGRELLVPHAKEYQDSDTFQSSATSEELELLNKNKMKVQPTFGSPVIGQEQFFATPSGASSCSEEEFSLKMSPQIDHYIKTIIWPGSRKCISIANLTGCVSDFGQEFYSTSQTNDVKPITQFSTSSVSDITSYKTGSDRSSSMGHDVQQNLDKTHIEDTSTEMHLSTYKLAEQIENKVASDIPLFLNVDDQRSARYSRLHKLGATDETSSSSYEIVDGRSFSSKVDDEGNLKDSLSQQVITSSDISAFGYENADDPSSILGPDAKNSVKDSLSLNLSSDVTTWDHDITYNRKEGKCQSGDLQETEDFEMGEQWSIINTTSFIDKKQPKHRTIMDRSVGPDGEIIERLITEEYLSDKSESSSRRSSVDSLVLAGGEMEKMDSEFRPITVFTHTVEEDPVYETETTQYEDMLPDGTIVHRKVIKTNKKQTVIKRVILEGFGEDEPFSDLNSASVVPHALLPNKQFTRYHDHTSTDPEVSTDVQLSEEKLSDGTLVRKRVTNTKQQQLTTERLVVGGTGLFEYSKDDEDDVLETIKQLSLPSEQGANSSE